MPLPSRDLAATAATAATTATTAATGTGTAGPTTSALRDRALDVLLDPGLAHVVELVCWLEKGLVHVADAPGTCARAPTARATVLAGRDPVADQDPYGDDHATPSPPSGCTRCSPTRARPTSPSCTPARTDWPERGGHLGEHGSLNGVQSRAPLLLSGPGVRARGVVDAGRPHRRRRRDARHLTGGGCDEHGGRAARSRRARRARTSSACCGTARSAPTCWRWRRTASCPTSPGCWTAAARCAAARSRSSRASRW